MRWTIWMLLATAVLLAGACGSQEQPPAKPDKPVAPATATQPPATVPPAVVPAKPAEPPPAVPAQPAKPTAISTQPDKTAGSAPSPTPPPAVKAPAKAEAPGSKVPDTLTLPASQGPVTLPHLVHAKAFPCATCHGNGTPGKIGLTKETAHALCRDCHKAKGAGPTACTGCHKK